MTRRRAAAPLPDEVVDHCAGPERLHEGREALALVQTYLETLDEPRRVLFVSQLIEGLSAAECGELLLQTAETCDYTSWGVDDEGNCFGGDGIAPADCQKVSLCTSQVCECAPGFPCSASSERLSELTIRLSDDGAVGLFSGAVFVNERGFQQPLGTVHFRRAEPSDLAPDAAP